MSPRKSLTIATCLAVLLFVLSSFCCPPVSAQTDESLAELRQRVLELTKQTKYTEALPLLEKIVAAEPDNTEMHFQLGFALIARGETVAHPGSQ